MTGYLQYIYELISDIHRLLLVLAAVTGSRYLIRWMLMTAKIVGEQDGALMWGPSRVNVDPLSPRLATPYDYPH
jgi:hypothetical protein